MLSKTQEEINLKEFKEKVINDYRTISLSREVSVMGRRDVLSGKGKFGIFGDGKELPQVVLSHFFKNGDYRSGYYRDQTLLLSQDLISPREIFSTFYGHADVNYERMSGGRQMAGHFLTEMLNIFPDCEALRKKSCFADVKMGSANPFLRALSKKIPTKLVPIMASIPI